ncbi:MAG: hypothetical protein ACO3NW_01610 [Kiritimatiellia bacterium]
MQKSHPVPALEAKRLEALRKCKILDSDEGEWHPLERYMKSHSEASFTHGICPDCREKLYPGI